MRTVPASSKVVVPAGDRGLCAAGRHEATPLTEGDKTEVLSFLSTRPIHTVIMSGLVRDNGVVSPLNRGRFYACRNPEGNLEGVALIGHITLIEVRSLLALEALARVARGSSHPHLILAEQEKARLFWKCYATDVQVPRLLHQELLFEQRWPVEARERLEGLQLATSDELPLVMSVQAEIAFEESGVNPMEADPKGFRMRCARRIEQRRVWVWVNKGRLIFKADVISETPDVNYLEGIWINPQERGRGYGLRCVSQLARTLLTRTNAITVLVNQGLPRVQNFYRKAGFHLRSRYETIYLHRPQSER